MAKQCSVTGCDNKYIAKGLCSTHRKINKKYGTSTPTCWCGEFSQTNAGNKRFSSLCKQHFFLERFWENVKVGLENECWEWQGSKTQAGYGNIILDGKVHYAHRLSLEFSGEVIPPRYHACHKCDNPSCVNPNHLFVGSPRENMLDKVSKGRQAFGEKHPNAILTDAEIIIIRQMAEDGVFFSDIAKIFDVSESHISRIVARLVRTTLPKE
jgi:hypothetical protein